MEQGKSNNLLYKVLLFNLSLVPLYIILIIQYIDLKFMTEASFKQNDGVWKFILQTNYLPLFLLVLIVIGCAGFYIFKKNTHYNREDPTQFIDIESKDFDHLTFLSTYIIPLITFQLDDFRSFIAMAVLIILIGWIYIKSNSYYLNPTLLIFGYKIYKAKTIDQNVVLISKGMNASSIKSRYIDLGNNIYLLKDSHN